MKPLRIDLFLQNRIAAPSIPVHLDGFLAYAMVKLNFDPEEATDPEYFRVLGEQLPIEKYEDQDDWFFKASMFTPTGAQTHSSEYFTQRIDQEGLAKQAADKRVSIGRKKFQDLKSNEGTIDVARGVHRNMLGFYGVSDSDQFHAYCVGDASQIADLLSSGYLTHFGPRRRSGYGEILRFEINEDTEAQTKCFNRNRHIKMTDSDVPVMRPIRAPYWNRHYQRPGFIPVDIA